jgi:simple sugar transport system ATP-binding protein
MRNMIKEGKSVILITHKLDEIKAVASRCTIIRRGKMVGIVDVAKTSQAEMASMMVGRPVNFKVEKGEVSVGSPVLEISHLNVLNVKKYFAVKDFSLTISRGEIVGIAGVDGNGQSELVEAITGLRPIESGALLFNGKDMANYSIRDRNEAGIGHIPEDRQKRGLIMTSSISDNMVIKEYYREPFSKNGVLQQKVIDTHAQEICDAFDVRSGEGIYSFAGKLSGGNQQKAIVGREMVLEPELIIAVQPTRGLDVGAIEYIHKRLVEHRDKGKAVLLVSFELDEIFNLSDRIAVMNSGELIDVVNTHETNEEKVGLMMAGVKKKEATV